MNRVTVKFSHDNSYLKHSFGKIMEILIQTAIMGIALSGLYALLATAIVLIFKATEVFNLGTGGLLLAGAYIFYFFFAQLGLPIWLCLLLLIILSIFLGLGIERLMMRHFIGQRDSLPAVMVTLALWVLLEGIVISIWGGGIKSYPAGLPTGVFSLGKAVLPSILLIGFLTAVIFVVGLMAFFQYHRMGLAMRVTAESHRIAQSLGIDVKKVFALSWGIATVLSAITGTIMAAQMGLSEVLPEIALKSLSVVLVGGANSFTGAVIGGLIVGITESFFTSYLTPFLGRGVGELAPFIILLIVLLFRPYGLFGIKGVERV